MVRRLVQYPEKLSLEFGVDVRVFDEKLFTLIDDLKDTITENNLEGLSAFQVGEYFNVVVVKDENGEFLELINPRIIQHKDKTVEEETTSYFPGINAKVPRYNEISVVYQDREANQKTLHVKGKLARVIQRKIDYTFGGTFLTKLSQKEREKIEKHLSEGISVAVAGECPTTFVRDRFMKVANILKILMVILLVSSFFVSQETSVILWDYQLYLSFAVVFFNGAYFVYGLYEGHKYKQCTSCQVGNFIGTVGISLTQLTLIMVLSYFMM
jgi:peptide deformylase